MSVYYRDASTGNHYYTATYGWSSFCGGGIIYIVPVTAQEYDACSRINTTAYYRSNFQKHYPTTAATIQAMWRDNFSQSSFYLTNRRTADIVMPFVRGYTVKFYNAGDEEYALFIQNSSTQATGYENMREKYAFPPNKAVTSRYSSRISPTDTPLVRPVIDKIISRAKVSRDYIIDLTDIGRVGNAKVKIAPKGSQWGVGAGRNGSAPAANARGRSVMVWGGKISHGVGHLDGDLVDDQRIDLLTYLNFASIQLKIASTNWNGDEYQYPRNLRVPPLVYGKRLHEDLLQMSLEGIAHGIRKQSAQIVDACSPQPTARAVRKHKPSTVWLVDNMDKNMSSGVRCTYSTGTVINYMLSENVNGKFSSELADGTTIYYHVCNIMAGNPTKTGRPIFVALVSLKPITEEQVAGAASKAA